MTTIDEAAARLLAATKAHKTELERISDKEREIEELTRRLPTIDPDERRGSVFASRARELATAREQLAALRTRGTVAAREVEVAKEQLAALERADNEKALAELRASIRKTEEDAFALGVELRDKLWGFAEAQRQRVANARFLEKALSTNPWAADGDQGSVLAGCTRENVVSMIGDLLARGSASTGPVRRRADDE